MGWSATRLRWLLLAGVLLLTAVVAGFFGMARYRAARIWQRILARSGASLRRETDGFTYSQSSKGRTVFTLHAARATPDGAHRWTLHDAVLILYGREPGREDRIYGKEFAYDQDEGVARAVGEVHLDLQAPEPGGKAPLAGARPPLGFGPEEGTAEAPGMIHVRTSGLVYTRKLGLATTAEPTEFQYGGMRCTSRGAEFDSQQSEVRLLADVRMYGVVHAGSFVLTAGHAELNRSSNTADLIAPMLVSGERSAQAAHAVLHLSKAGALTAAEASGAVELRAGTRVLGAPQATAVFGAEDRPQLARLFSGVSFADMDRGRPAQGSSATLDLIWTPEGLLREATAAGSVRFQQSAPATEGVATRELSGDRLVAEFVSAAGRAGQRAVLQRVRLLGRAEMGSGRQTSGSSVGQGSSTTVAGDELTTVFAANPQRQPVAETLSGQGHTRLEQRGSDGSRQRSSGDQLQVAFRPSTAGAGAEEVGSAVQTGHVEVVSSRQPKGATAPEETTAHAAKAVYAGEAKTLTLTGSGEGGRAVVLQNGGTIEAAEVVLQQVTGDAEATGGVVATSLAQGGRAATHVQASRARLLHAAGLSEFFGEAGLPAQLWQGGSQVQAAEITLDGRQHGMSARPGDAGDVVWAVFAPSRAHAGPEPASDRPKEGVAAHGNGGAGAGGPLPQAARSAVRVSARRMDFDDGQHQALFSGDVRLLGVAGEVTAERGVATLKPASGTGAGVAGRDAGNVGTDKAGSGALSAGPDMSGGLERMVMLGDVRMVQPGRLGVGQQLTYTAASDSFVLTGSPGKPPRVTGERGSVVTGPTLLFRNGDSTIVVADTGAGPKSQTSGGARVHTETDLKQNRQDQQNP